MKELIADAMVALVTKDFSKLLPKIKEALPELIQIVIGCITEDKKVAEEQPELKDYAHEVYCKQFCSCFDQNTENYRQCYDACVKNP